MRTEQHSEHTTLALSEIDGPKSATEVRVGGYVTYWCSDNGQSDLLMGWGDTEDASEDTARAECEAEDVTGGHLRTFLVI